VRIPVVGLLGRPGQRRPLHTAVPPTAFGEDPWGPSVERIDGDVALDLTLESVVEGILVRGTVGVTVIAACARCLTPTREERSVVLTELHRPEGSRDAGRDTGRERGRDRGHDDGWVEDWVVETEGDDDLDYHLVEGDTQLELDRMVRDALVVDRPVRVLCRPDCAGLCVTCGADRNLTPCDHGDEAPVDPRWEALRGLRLPPAGPA
jgi:uncharacterized protein